MIVSPGFTASLEGKKLASTTYGLSTSWALQLTSSADCIGSQPHPAASRGLQQSATVAGVDFLETPLREPPLKANTRFRSASSTARAGCKLPSSGEWPAGATGYRTLPVEAL